MKDASFYVGGLLDLDKLRTDSDRRATWRQSMAALARATEDDGPGPLDALHPEALLLGVKAALQAGLVDDLEWLEPSKAGAALYELASALPLGPERRDLGRRVLERLLEGNAEAFVALATRMALGAGKGLSTAAVRARLLLVTEMPLDENLADGPLALALVQRRELAREWVDVPSTGSLPGRRFAARLLERAAREAARRAQQGDLHPLRAFRGDAVSKAYDRLLADRESLVWRHVAVARGLLSPWVPELDAELDASLGAGLTPTEWRRGATSIAAKIAVNPEKAVRAAKAAIAGGALHRDAGIGPAFVWGLARAAEAEPAAAAALLDELAEHAPANIAESIVELYTELGRAELVDRAAAKVTLGLEVKATPAPGDDGAEALLRETQRDLDRSRRQDEPIREQLARALEAYAGQGARAAYLAAKEVLTAAGGQMDALAAVGDDDDSTGRVSSMARRASLAALRDLDTSLLERGTLDCLLHLGTKDRRHPVEGSEDDGARAHEEVLDGLRERLAEWILARESVPLVLEPGAVPTHPTLRLRRLRALLHLVDSDVGDSVDDGAHNARLRERWRRIASVLGVRFEEDSPSVVRRTISAALARALDALVRACVCDVTDALLVVARVQVDPKELETLAEAAMDPDLVHVFARYARFLGEWTAPSEIVVTRQLAALEELARELVTDASGRREAVRTVLVRLHSALAAVQAAPSLRALSTSGGNDPDVLGSLEQQIASLAQLMAGARARLAPAAPSARAQTSTLPPGSADRSLSLAVSRVLEGADPELREDLVQQWLADLDRRIPVGIARVIGSCVATLLERPAERASVVVKVNLAEAQLPAWLPASRTLGGFYVQRPLGKGAVGSVFICTRSEDRNDPNAERFALKVPEYSATAARNLSEHEFLQLFRAEASALMAVPPHPNLARFVTFDLSARPKPILVMELVEGDMLERVIASRAFDTTRALRALDDVLSGLQAMHSVGVGHLDLKPSNVVQSKGEDAVLVDFGLAGRHIRPGCATGPYGAPEVWGVVPDNVEPSPPMADVYAFGCLAFEALTGRVLFEADSEIAQVSLHLAHDGLPPQLKAMGARQDLVPLSELLFATLRRDPRNRPTVPSVRSELRRLAPKLAHLPWPIA